MSCVLGISADYRDAAAVLVRGGCLAPGLNCGAQIEACLGWVPRLLVTPHHMSHAANCFYPSPFEDAAILTIDGVAEWATCTLGAGSGAQIEPLPELCEPHSLGLLYGAITAHCGCKVNSGEYELMELGPAVA